MRLPLRISRQSPLRKIIAAAVIGIVAAMISVVAQHHVPGTSIALDKLDYVIYDSLYHLRPIQSQRDGPVVIVAVDDASLADLAHGMIGKTPYGSPWPRQFWGAMIGYINRCGAKAIVFDVIFTEPSVYNDVSGDDDTFAAAVNASKVPVILATLVSPDGRLNGFAPPVKKPIFGAANVGNDVVFRTYQPIVHGVPSLAHRAASIAGAKPFESSFFLHYYGPYRDQQGTTTFKYLAASHVLGSSVTSKFDYGIRPEMIRNKIVVIGGITAGTYDLKSSPLSEEYPGVEVQATAIANMLAGQQVLMVPAGCVVASLLVGICVSIGVVFPRRVILKLTAAMLVLAALLAIAAGLFVRQRIYFLPLAAPLLTLLLATVASFAWSYLTEGRQRRFVVKALGQYLSPQVAANIDRDPDALKLGGVRRDMTVMFTDIQGFTDLSEKLDEHKLTELLNYYLDEMSSLVLANNGTLDKYIGDAIMSFWNAPLVQEDHAILACRAALAMEKREAEIQPKLAQLGANGLLTRIGINTGPMVFGNMGSSQKFNYSVLGDSVNLASLLEGANKFYGSRILIAQPTAEQVKDHFLLRKLDVLRVKGKQKPMAVYEVLAEGSGNSDSQFRAAQYEAAFELYQRQQWEAAQEKLKAVLSRFPDDAPAAALSRRISDLSQHPPGPDWDGVYIAKGK
jgi:adenylate cyclase